MSKNDEESSDSEKNFDIQTSTSYKKDTMKAMELDEDFGEDDEEPTSISKDEKKPACVANGLRRSNNLDDEIWNKGSFDVNQLHQLRELYNIRQNRTEEDDEQEYLDSLKESNTDELQSLRQATAVLEKFESQPYVEEPVTLTTQGRRIRPQRFLGAAGRYPNKMLQPSLPEEQLVEGEDLDEGIVEPKDKEVSPTSASGPTVRVGAAFIDHFNLDDEGGATMEFEAGQRSTRRAKVDASNRLQGAVSSTQTRSRGERFVDSSLGLSQRLSQKAAVYHDEQGQLIVNSEVVGNLCDCLAEDCSGCFFACSNCGSNKCGPLCRSRRSQFAYCVAEPKQKVLVPIHFNPFRGAIRQESPVKVSPDKLV